MISGTFIPRAQEWRYYSREKSLIHTLHLAELPSGTIGDSVFIQIVPPTGTGGIKGNGFGIGSGTVPDLTPWRNISWNGTTGYMVSPYGTASVFQNPPAVSHPGIAHYSSIPFGPNHFDSGYWFSLSGTCPPQGDPGGLCLIVYRHPLAFPISFGTSIQPAPEGSTNYVFVSDKGPDTFDVNGYTWPPPNMQQLNHVDNICHENGPEWQTDLMVLQLQGNVDFFDNMLLVDNISYPHNGLPGKYVGQGGWFSVVHGTVGDVWTAENSCFVVKVGPMNLLDGPNWYPPTS